MGKINPAPPVPRQIRAMVKAIMLSTSDSNTCTFALFQIITPGRSDVLQAIIIAALMPCDALRSPQSRDVTTAQPRKQFMQRCIMLIQYTHFTAFFLLLSKTSPYSCPSCSFSLPSRLGGMAASVRISESEANHSLLRLPVGKRKANEEMPKPRSEAKAQAPSLPQHKKILAMASRGTNSGEVVVEMGYSGTVLFYTDGKKSEGHGSVSGQGGWRTRVVIGQG